MKELKHLMYFERLLDDAHNELCLLYTSDAADD